MPQVPPKSIIRTNWLGFAACRIILDPASSFTIKIYDGPPGAEPALGEEAWLCKWTSAFRSAFR